MHGCPTCFEALRTKCIPKSDHRTKLDPVWWGGIARRISIKVDKMVPACCVQSRREHRGHVLCRSASRCRGKGRALRSATTPGSGRRMNESNVRDGFRSQSRLCVDLDDDSGGSLRCPCPTSSGSAAPGATAGRTAAAGRATGRTAAACGGVQQPTSFTGRDRFGA